MAKCPLMTQSGHRPFSHLTPSRLVRVGTMRRFYPGAATRRVLRLRERVNGRAAGEIYMEPADSLLKLPGHKFFPLVVRNFGGALYFSCNPLEVLFHLMVFQIRK